MSKGMIVLFKIIAALAGCATAFLWFLVLVGFVVGRHLDDGGFALGRVKLFAVYSVCTLIAGIAFDFIAENAQDQL
jgi:hypothetical protein